MSSAPEPSRFMGSATKWSVGAALLLTVLLPAAGALAQDQADLAKASQNPVAAMISLPLQNNTFFGIGPDDDTANVLNIQPVIPINLGPVNLINRTIVPLIYLPDVTAGLAELPEGISGGSTFGSATSTTRAFCRPRSRARSPGASGLDQLPERDRQEARHREVERRAVRGRAGSAWPVRDRHAGPAALVVRRRRRPPGRQPAADPAVRELQHGGGWFLTSAPIITANWEGRFRRYLAGPLGGGGGRVFKIGPQPVNMSLQAYYNVEAPHFGPDWSCGSPSRSCSRSERRRTR